MKSETITPKHLFVLVGTGSRSGWWLKITNADELADYHDKHGNKYGNALLNIMHDKNAQGTHGPNVRELPLSQAAYYHAINHNISPIESLVDIAHQTHIRQLQAIQEYGAVYINSVGGWNWGTDFEITQRLWKEGFAFPSFTKADIRISKFPGGEHYYAHIGPMEVRDGDIMKWSSREEAYQHALACLPED